MLEKTKKVFQPHSMMNSINLASNARHAQCQNSLPLINLDQNVSSLADHFSTISVDTQNIGPIDNEYGYEIYIEDIFDALNRADISKYYLTIPPVFHTAHDTFHELFEVENDGPRLPHSQFEDQIFTPQHISDSFIEKPLVFRGPYPVPTHFLPSQHYCFGVPIAPPENYPIWDSLQSLTTHELCDWPSSLKAIRQPKVPGKYQPNSVPVFGDYHYLHIQTDFLDVLIQVTDYELFCLGNHNFNKFGGCLNFVGRENRYWIHLDHLYSTNNLELLFGRGNTREIWSYFFYGFFEIEMMMCDSWYSEEEYERLFRVIMDNLFDQDYLKKFCKHFFTFRKWWIPTPDELQHVDIDDVRSWYRHKLRNKRRRFYRSRRNKKPRITLQGMFDFVKTVTNNETREEILTSVNELGKLAQTMNAAKDTFNSFTENDWYKGLMSYIMSFAGYLNDLANDFAKFSQNPVNYIEFLKSHAHIGFQVPLITIYDATKTSLILAASIALFEKSNILSIGLFLYAIHSFLNTCMTPGIARPCALIITLCYIGVMKAIQLRPAFIELQGSKNLTEMIYATVTFVTLACGAVGVTKTPKSVVKHLFDSTKDLFAISKGTLALSRCVEFIVDAFKRCMEFCFGDTFMYQALVKLSVSSDDLKDYIVYAMTIKPDALSARLTLDPEAKKEWSRMCELHSNFLLLFASGKPPTENHIGYSMYSKACNAFIELQEEYNKIKDSLDYFRVEPFMIWIWGKPGVGKTWCRDAIINNTYAWHKAIDPTIEAKSTGLLYTRNPADKYMSEYKGQFAVAYDDVGQNRQSDNPEFNEIMGMGSTNQVQLNMADLKDKGRMFSSKVIIMAANSQGVTANDLILSPSAFNRRRHIVIHVDRPDAESDGNLATSKSDFTKVALELTDPITGAHIVRFPATGFGENDATFNQMFEWLAPKYWHHVKSQTEALHCKEDNLRKVLDNLPEANVIRINPETGEVVKNESTTPLTEKPQFKQEFYDTVDTETFVTRERQIIYEKIRLQRCVNQKFDQLCSVMIASKQPSEHIKKQFDVFCKYEFGRVLTSEEFVRMFETKEFEMSPEVLLSLKDYWEYIKGESEKKFPWMKVLGALGGFVSVFAIYKLLSSLFGTTKEDIFDLQGYTLETMAPRTNPVVIQQNEGLKNFSEKFFFPGYSGSEEDKQRILSLLEMVPEKKAEMFDKIILEKYDNVTMAPRTNAVTIQEEEKLDNIEQVHMNLRESMARFSRLREVEGGYATRSMNGFNIAFKIWLLPRHFFGKNIEDTPVEILRDNKPSIQVILKKEKIIPYQVMTNGKMKTKDLVLVEIDQLDSGRKHIQHFAKSVHLQNTKVFHSKMLKWNRTLKRVEEAHTGRALRWDIPQDITHDGVALYYSDGYSYDYQSEEGDCGSLLVSMDKTCQARIYGIHFGYDHTQHRGLSMNVPREDLEYLLDYFPKVEKIIAGKPRVVTQACEVPVSLQDADGTSLFEFCGKVYDAPLTPKEHKDLFRSPIFNQIYPAEKDLSVLSMYDDRMDPEFRGEPDILTRGVIDFEHKSIPWPEYELDIASVALYGEFTKFNDIIDRKVQNIDFALNGKWVDGTRLEYTEPLNLKTSAGYGLPGIKRQHFVETDLLDENGKLLKHDISILNPVLQKMVDDQWNDWMNGVTHPCIWSHALKSEPIKLSKIRTGNTRTFCVAQTAFLINVRRLFGSFTSAMKASKIKSFSCLGTDACSPDWNSLYNNLRETGPKGVDLDFFKFDRTAVTWQLARRVCLAINKWYNDDMKYQRARLIAFEDMIFSYALVGKYLTRKRRGNPSGNPLTTELNNCVNYLMLCMVYLLIAKHRKPTEYGIPQWKRNINMKAYGDDIIFTVHPECMVWFDLALLTEIYNDYGVPVTPADKSDAGIVYKDLKELTFLKRTFISFDHPYVKWIGALDKTSIRNMIQFYRLKPHLSTMQEAMSVNCHESLREAYYWGQEFFEEHLDNLNKWFVKNNYPQIFITYKELDETFRAKIKSF
ncbi:hypothetical protein 1 [Hubei picorna-like virus 78]|uniref:hypothetical protein 1 n=1 Tax=Hubei picorna-like virus 78 TaxID=1923162 RepID=UPI00090A43C8|nr:hypothetical protein 1 [Hubei picorna-like virus 78]APG78432.1 hypothetical protein 1 [Hubei picorna-like virus 78]